MCDPTAVGPLSLSELFIASFDKYSRRCAVVDEQGIGTSYGELAALANQLAHFFLERGTLSGHPVAIMLPNCTEFLVADQAVIRAGAAKVAINGMLSVDEQCHALRASRARIAVVGESQVTAASRVWSEAGDLEVLVVVGTPADGEAIAWADALEGMSTQAPELATDGTGMGRLSFTGGTTGLPKAIVHINERIVLNLLSHVIEMELGDDERLLLTSPLAHAAGLFMEAALLRGGTIYLGNHFDGQATLDRIRHDEITYLFLVPTMLYRLLDALDLDDQGIPTVRTVLYGAAPVNPERLRQGLRLLGNVFIQFYGQAEAPNFLTRLGRSDHVLGSDRPEILTSCGRAVTMARLRVVDDEGASLPVREVGEIIVSTAYTMAGYADNSAATSEALRDGWLRTGDLGWIDEDGYVHLVDRSKDMIITGGLNVYCREVERAIAALEPIADVAVFGLPDPEWGEIVVAAVVPNPGEVIDLDWVKEQAGMTLARYKLPKSMRVVASLPLTGVGKHDKKSLRASWQAGAVRA